MHIFKSNPKPILSMSLPEAMKQIDSEFINKYPEYVQTDILDELRHSEYGRIDNLGHVYLDYTGGGLYSEKQVQTHMHLLLENVFGNPHSTNPTSQAMTELVIRARESVLKFFNASPEEYECIFTPNASGGLKLVGESYPFGPGDTYLLTFDNHNSVNGIREFARAKGAVIHYSPVLPPEMRIDDDKLKIFLDFRAGGNNCLLFQHNPTLRSSTFSLMELIWRLKKGWDVLLDGAALFLPINWTLVKSS